MWGIPKAVCGLGLGVVLAGSVCSLPASAQQQGAWMVDPATNCGTNNPFYVPGENIRWFGGCQNGKLQGYGTLIWYQGTTETQRNEGSFNEGEFHGQVVTTFPDGQVIHGQYANGVRQGEFLVARANGARILASYDNGTLVGQRTLDAGEANIALQRLAAPSRAQAAQPTQPQAQPQAQVRMQAQPVQQTAQVTRPAVNQPMTQTVAKEDDWFFAFLSALNPANWGIGEALGSLFGTTSSAQAMPKPVSHSTDSRVVTANQMPAAAQMPPQAQPQVQAYAPTPMAAPAQQYAPQYAAQAAPQYPSAPQYAPTEQRVDVASMSGRSYDMRALLSQPHPFARTTAKATMPVVPSPAPAPAPAVYAPAPPAVPVTPVYNLGPTATSRAEVADSLFAMGYQMERKGDTGRAAEAYEQVVSLYPSVPSAVIANERLNDLRRRSLPGMTQAALPAVVPAAPAQPQTSFTEENNANGAGARVIVMNSPFPASMPVSKTPEPTLSLLHGTATSPLISRNVCSRPGLYDSESRWCGIVRRDDGDILVVEVRDVQLNGFGTIGISRSECTGGVMLNWFSRGTQVRVSRQCLAMNG